jgi:glycosyltransferase involved in cell wall biosynthesis
MASNLPVIASRFGALSRVFNEGDGFYFVNGLEDIIEAITSIKRGAPVNTRELVMGFSWSRLTVELREIYLQLDQYDGVNI